MPRCERCNNIVRTNGDPQWLQGGYCEACGELLCGLCVEEFDADGRCKRCQEEDRPTRWAEAELFATETAGA
jgi:hypothetical protein